MNRYTVIYVNPSEGLDLHQFFKCQADDEDHAEEQCLNAYPDCEVIQVERNSP